MIAVIRTHKDTQSERRFLDERTKVIEAHNQGRLGRNWYTKNPKSGKLELRPKRLFKRL